jgi:hypothetical protein
METLTDFLVVSLHWNSTFPPSSCNKQGMLKAAQRRLTSVEEQEQPQHSLPGPSQDPRPSGYLKLKGLPFNATQEDILIFFARFQVLSVHFVHEADGRRSGLVGSFQQATLAFNHNLINPTVDTGIC